jgi:hypothetical protein
MKYEYKDALISTIGLSLSFTSIDHFLQIAVLIASLGVASLGFYKSWNEIKNLKNKK